MWGFLDGRECKEIGALLSRSYITSIDGAVLVLRIEKLLHQNKIDIWVCNFAMWKGEGKSNWMWRRRGRKSTIVGTCEGGVRIGNGACISLRNALTSLSLNTPSPPWSCSSSNTHYHPNTSHLPTICWNPRGGKVLEIGEVDDRRKWSSGKINRSVSHHFPRVRWIEVWTIMEPNILSLLQSPHLPAHSRFHLQITTFKNAVDVCFI